MEAKQFKEISGSGLWRCKVIQEDEPMTIGIDWQAGKNIITNNMVWVTTLNGRLFYFYPGEQQVFDDQGKLCTLSDRVDVTTTEISPTIAAPKTEKSEKTSKTQKAEKSEKVSKTQKAEKPTVIGISSTQLPHEYLANVHVYTSKEVNQLCTIVFKTKQLDQFGRRTGSISFHSLVTPTMIQKKKQEIINGTYKNRGVIITVAPIDTSKKPPEGVVLDKETKKPIWIHSKIADGNDGFLKFDKGVGGLKLKKSECNESRGTKIVEEFYELAGVRSKKRKGKKSHLASQSGDFLFGCTVHGKELLKNILPWIFCSRRRSIRVSCNDPLTKSEIEAILAAKAQKYGTSSTYPPFIDDSEAKTVKTISEGVPVTAAQPAEESASEDEQDEQSEESEESQAEQPSRSKHSKIEESSEESSEEDSKAQISSKLAKEKSANIRYISGKLSEIDPSNIEAIKAIHEQSKDMYRQIQPDEDQYETSEEEEEEDE